MMRQEKIRWIIGKRQMRALCAHEDGNNMQNRAKSMGFAPGDREEDLTWMLR